MHKKIVPSVLAEDTIQHMIFIIRGKRVMIDNDLALLYRVKTKALNQAVKRNNRRFPDDFMFRLNKKEMMELVTMCDRLKTLKHSSKPPLAFTHDGVAMLSSVLHSEYAIRVNVQIMRTFTRIREYLATHRELEKRLDELETKYDTQFRSVFEAIRELLNPAEPKRKPIGFHSEH